MKRIVKIVLWVLVVAAIGAAVYMNMNQPLSVNAVLMAPQTAELTFTEQGVVDYENSVSVYSPVSGKIVETDVSLGQAVKAGDPICKIDNSDTALAISKSKAQISSLQAQIDGQKSEITGQQAAIVNLQAQISGFEAQKRSLDSDTAKERDTLTTQKNNLEKQLDSLTAQQNSAGVSKEDQANMQNIILTQNQADIDRLTNDYNNVKILYDNGVVPETELQAGQTALDAAKAQYEQNQQQLQIIQNGDAQSSDAYFAASRGAIQEQINGIDTSLSKDYSGAMKDYYDAQIQGVNAQIDGVGAQIDGLNEQVSSLNAQIDAVNVDIQEQEKLQKDSTIVSTVDGVVSDLPASASNMAYSASPVAVIATGRSLVNVYVSTNDIDNVSVGKDVDLILRRREGDETYKATVVKIDDKAEVQVSSLGVEERKVKVYVQPKEHPELFITGYDADVRFLVYQKENALIVPKTAVFKDGDADRVWIIKDGVLQKADVTKGQELTNDVVIEGGLSAGDAVVTDSTQKELKVGAKAVAASS